MSTISDLIQKSLDHAKSQREEEARQKKKHRRAHNMSTTYTTQVLTKNLVFKMFYDRQDNKVVISQVNQPTLLPFIFRNNKWRIGSFSQTSDRLEMRYDIDDIVEEAIYQYWVGLK